MENQWKTTTFALHTEGQPKLKFSDFGFSPPPEPLENLKKTITFALHTEGQPKLKFSEVGISARLKHMENLWKTITFVFHTEGQPKLKFSESGISEPPNLWKTYGKPSLLLSILRANLSLNSAILDFL